MPNIKSAKKRVKVNAVKAMQNKALKSNLKTVIKKAELATAEGAADMQDVCWSDSIQTAFLLSRMFFYGMTQSAQNRRKYQLTPRAALFIIETR